jgi:hypothetical protein
MQKEMRDLRNREDENEIEKQLDEIDFRAACLITVPGVVLNCAKKCQSSAPIFQTTFAENEKFFARNGKGF